MKNARSKSSNSEVAQRLACRAHNPEVNGSKPFFATFFIFEDLFLFVIVFLL